MFFIIIRTYYARQNIFNRIKKEVKNVDKLKIKVIKICPPINGDVENVAIIIEE